MTATAARLPKGTRVRYLMHTRMARGGGWTTTRSTGTIIGYYADQYVIQNRFGKRRTREDASAILSTEG